MYSNYFQATVFPNLSFFLYGLTGILVAAEFHSVFHEILHWRAKLRKIDELPEQASFLETVDKALSRASFFGLISVTKEWLSCAAMTLF